MSIRGVGTDLVAIARIAEVLERHPQRFPARVLTEAEQAVWRQRNRSIGWLARRFAAKEAVAKALGTGIGAAVGFQDLEIGNDAAGAPQVHLQGGAAERARALGGEIVHLSLSDERRYAVAFAVLES
ncbi:holo-ACP synthase [Methylonatrum kenyense]|uniref:holo-ACP synthase n=1 Tax=Methylonatrum kenyense TaxID=455253 RepID=UPI0020BDF597|nr:holo-ACP synthase [Methylonatrum kenyense]